MFLTSAGHAGSIAFNLSRDEYADQPAAERQQFTIYVEQSPGYCNLHNAMIGRRLGHVTSNRWELSHGCCIPRHCHAPPHNHMATRPRPLRSARGCVITRQTADPRRPRNFSCITTYPVRILRSQLPILIDGDSQPDGTLDPDRDPALPKVFIRPKESLCWRQPDQTACESTLYCKTCAPADRHCYWDSENAARGFGGCKHSTPAALRDLMSTALNTIIVAPTGCPDADRDESGFTPNVGLRLSSAGATVRGLGIVGFGRGGLAGNHGGLHLDVEAAKYAAGECVGDDGRVDGEVRVEGCYLAGNDPTGLVARNSPLPPFQPAIVHVVVKSSELRRTIIESNAKHGVWLLHLEALAYWANATIEDAVIGAAHPGAAQNAIYDLTGTNFSQDAGISTFDGATLVVNRISETGDEGPLSTGIEIFEFSGVRPVSTTSLTVANSRFARNNADAIYVLAANRATVLITNSTFEGGRGGVDVKLGARIVSITDSSFLGNAHAGLELRSTATVTRSRFENNARAIFVDSQANGTRIADSTFTGHTDTTATVLSQANGVGLINCSFSSNVEGLHMQGNTTHISWTSIRDTEGTALTLDPETPSSTLVLAELSHVMLVNGGTGLQVAHALDLNVADSTVSGFTRSTAAGVALNHVANAALNNVTIESNAGGGLDLVSCTNSSISASHVSANTGSDGVHVHVDSVGAVLSSVSVRSNSGNGLLIEGPNATVTSAVASGNGEDGVHVSALATGFHMSGTSAAPVTITNNGGSGVHVAAASVAITGAVYVGVADLGLDRLGANGNGAHGIFATETATDAIIGGGVVVAGNGRHGISVAGNGTVVSNCIIAGNGGDGIVIAGAESSIAGCLVGVGGNGSVSMPNGGAGIRLEVSATSAQIGRAGTFTAVGGAQGGPGIDVSAPDVAISSVTVGASVDTDTPVALPNCHAGIWLRAGASRATVIDSSVAGADADCRCCTAVANDGYGVLVDAADATLLRCRVGVGGRQDDVDIGNDVGGIFLSATNGTITHTLVGNSGGHGVTVAAGAEESVRVQHNVIGDCRGRNCSNRGHGIFFEADMNPATIAERMNNNTIGFNGRAGLRVGQSSLAEARADLANTVSSTTNSWMFFNACDLCECTMYCYDATGANASACRPGQLPHNFSEVDCSSLDLGPDFPQRFPASVTGFTMRDAGARRVELSAVASTVAAVDLQGNPDLDASTAIGSARLLMLRYLDLDGTIVGEDLVDAMRGLEHKDRLEFLSVADASAGSTPGLVLDLAGFASLTSLSWSNAATCPVGFYDTASIGAGATAGGSGSALCTRCPVNTHQPLPGQIGQDRCIPCADGTYDYDQDPTTECENSLFSLNATVWPNTTVNAVVTGRGLLFPVCSEPCVHDRYQFNYSYTLRLNPVENMFNNNTGLDAVAFATFIYDAGLAGGGCSLNGPLGPLLTPNQAAVSVDSRDGTTSFKPMTTGRRFVAVVDATDLSSRATVTVRRWCFDVLESDLDAPNSNDGSVCANGDRVEDEFQLNRNYTCQCFLDVGGTALWQGRNCDQANVDRVVGSAKDPGSDTLVMAGALGGTLVLCCIIIARQRYKIHRKKKIENTPVDFAARLSLLERQGLVRPADGGGMAGDDELDDAENEATVFIQPVELRRKYLSLLDTLGAGAFGEVMKGVYSPPGRNLAVAVKVLKGAPSADEREELLKEAFITAQFNHPNVVGLVGVVTAGSPQLLVLHLCEGGALRTVLREKLDDIPGGDLLGYSLGMCKGMHYLASRNFVHRDLATRNVLLDARQNPKVADFGLSRDMETAEYYRTDENARLPIRWSAPECINEQKFSEKSDVWAFGVTMVEIYTRGETPYRGWTNAYILDQLDDGFTLPVPMACPDKVYTDCIAPCLQMAAEDRPTFLFLVNRLDLFMRSFGQLTVTTVEERTRRLEDQARTTAEVAAAKAEAEDQYEDFGAIDAAPAATFVGFGTGGTALVENRARRSSSSRAADLATIMMLEEEREVTVRRMSAVSNPPPGSDQIAMAAEVSSAYAADDYEDMGATSSVPTTIFLGFGAGGTARVRDLAQNKVTAKTAVSLKVPELTAATMVGWGAARRDGMGGELPGVGGAGGPPDQGKDSTEPLFYSPATGPRTIVDSVGADMLQYRETSFSCSPVLPDGAGAQDTGASGRTSPPPVATPRTLPGGASPPPATAPRNSSRSPSLDSQRDELLAWHKEHATSDASVEDTIVGPNPGAAVRGAAASDALQTRLFNKSRGMSRKGRGRRRSVSSNASKTADGPPTADTAPGTDVGYLEVQGLNQPVSNASAGTAALAPGVDVAMSPVRGFDVGDLGRRVKLTTTALTGDGVLRFVGLHTDKGVPRVGIEMDGAVGLNDGTVNGVRYFECQPRHGVLVNPSKVRFGDMPSVVLLAMSDISDDDDEVII